MPNLSETLLHRFGISVYMYYLDVGVHRAPHLHVIYQGEQAVLGLPGGELLSGSVPNKALRKARAWIELNREELMERWEQAARGETITRID